MPVQCITSLSFTTDVGLPMGQGGVEMVVVLDPAHGTASEAVDEANTEDTGADTVPILQQDHDKDAELYRRFQQRCVTIGGAMELLHSGNELHTARASAKHKIFQGLRGAG